ncbi:MAG: hypothetical protein ABSB10_06130 [Candidatus Bathyarchaeia archaeon]|jgi:hypothetical protein
MKRQTGVRVEAEVWGAYRAVCGREKLRPSIPIEEFLRLVLENDSASSLLSMMRGVAKARAEGFEAYARVLLDWYTHEKFWFHVEGDEDTSVEGLLLNALKLVVDSELRRQIEEALIASQRQRFEKGKS